MVNHNAGERLKSLSPFFSKPDAKLEATAMDDTSSD
jgi:hypothetical protein